VPALPASIPRPRRRSLGRSGARSRALQERFGGRARAAWETLLKWSIERAGLDSVAIGANDDIVIGGHGKSVDLGGGVLDSGEMVAFVGCFDEAGSLEWTNSFRAAGTDDTQVAVAPDDSIRSSLRRPPSNLGFVGRPLQAMRCALALRLGQCSELTEHRQVVADCPAFGDASVDEAVGERDVSRCGPGGRVEAHEPATWPGQLTRTELHDHVTFGDDERANPAATVSVTTRVPQEGFRSLQARRQVCRECVIDHVGRAKRVEDREIAAPVAEVVELSNDCLVVLDIHTG
jgi:hypothetical protein